MPLLYRIRERDSTSLGGLIPTQTHIWAIDAVYNCCSLYKISNTIYKLKRLKSTSHSFSQGKFEIRRTPGMIPTLVEVGLIGKSLVFPGVCTKACGKTISPQHPAVALRRPRARPQRCTAVGKCHYRTTSFPVGCVPGVSLLMSLPGQWTLWRSAM